MATGLDPAERQFDTTAGAVIVDIDLTGANLARQSQLTAAIAGPDAADQTEVGTIGDTCGIGFIIERHGRQYRAENFLLRQRMLRRHVLEQHRRLIETALRRRRINLALTGNRDTVLSGVRQEFLYPLQLRLPDQRTAIQIHLR